MLQEITEDLDLVRATNACSQPHPTKISPMAPEVWTVGAGVPKFSAYQAERAERAGYDGILYVDSQNLTGDPYVAMALAAAATSTIKVGTGVTNPLTRHAAAAAAAAASVQAESGGRVLLGIGRGDSSLAHLGLAPVKVDAFERYLAALQAYLRGDDVPFEQARWDRAEAPAVDALGLAGQPTTSRLHWLDNAVAKVPVTVSATGPKVIEIAARHADRITFAVGADTSRLEWAIATARKHNGPLSVGAFVNVVAHPDADTARDLASGGVASFARFSVMHGRVAGPTGADDHAVLSDIHARYDMTYHTQAGAPQTGALTDDFAHRFAVLGPPTQCADRLRELAALGLDHLVIVGPSIDSDRTESNVARRCFAEEVMPALRESS